nr:PREDICTED: uncharacterized protein LOC108952046 [Musa acuminata subsp. malaccensis]
MSRKRSRSEAGRCAAESGTKADGASVASGRWRVIRRVLGGEFRWACTCGRTSVRAVTDGFGTGDRTRSHGSQDGVGDGRDSDSGESGCATLQIFFYGLRGSEKGRKNIEVYADQLKSRKATLVESLFDE